MQREAYPQMEITSLEQTGAVKKIVESVSRYGEGYYRVKGQYPPKISLSKKDLRTLRDKAPSGVRLTWRGAPVEVARGW